ncbi:DUF4062 domain-containing protein [uncultured Thiodictyon sp.]|uniref:DUF4062 domain-containing protein n=1 Tax=uncultured Thiodictyon sp. TaxID=1846217 RepID=UPI0025FB476B|nr:DUF4062 domain-containing protein [uncultured Thiodictyon sp.]
MADLQENWTAADQLPLAACLERVRAADVLVVILAHRYGGVLVDAALNPEGKSITWLEREAAVAAGRPVLAFVLDEGADWPAEYRQDAALKSAAALEDDDQAEAMVRDARKAIRGLKAFKAWIDARGLRRTFGTQTELKLEVARALMDWLRRQTGTGAGAETPIDGPPPISPAYLAWLRQAHECVELLGLEVQAQHPTQLSQVYVLAITPAWSAAARQTRGRPTGGRTTGHNTNSCSVAWVMSHSIVPATPAPASPPSAAGLPWSRSAAPCPPTRSPSRTSTARRSPRHCASACRSWFRYVTSGPRCP